ncbi:MAG: hypothetical protein Q7J34_09440 [Bacteroidales bacterium]|jgi:hypothetical protein|nr:hypothetical protein [Bacteroidales bacterium]
MNISAIIMMASVWTVVISLSVYFFYRIYTCPKKQEPDSYSENDDDE